MVQRVCDTDSLSPVQNDNWLTYFCEYCLQAKTPSLVARPPLYLQFYVLHDLRVDPDTNITAATKKFSFTRRNLIRHVWTVANKTAVYSALSSMRWLFIIVQEEVCVNYLLHSFNTSGKALPGHEYIPPLYANVRPYSTPRRLVCNEFFVN